MYLSIGKTMYGCGLLVFLVILAIVSTTSVVATENSNSNNNAVPCPRNDPHYCDNPFDSSIVSDPTVFCNATTCQWEWEYLDPNQPPTICDGINFQVHSVEELNNLTVPDALEPCVAWEIRFGNYTSSSSSSSAPGESGSNSQGSNVNYPATSAPTMVPGPDLSFDAILLTYFISPTFRRRLGRQSNIHRQLIVLNKDQLQELTASHIVNEVRTMLGNSEYVVSATVRMTSVQAAVLRNATIATTEAAIGSIRLAAQLGTPRSSTVNQMIQSAFQGPALDRYFDSIHHDSAAQDEAFQRVYSVYLGIPSGLDSDSTTAGSTSDSQNDNSDSWIKGFLWIALIAGFGAALTGMLIMGLCWCVSSRQQHRLAAAAMAGGARGQASAGSTPPVAAVLTTSKSSGSTTQNTRNSRTEHMGASSEGEEEEEEGTSETSPEVEDPQSGGSPPVVLDHRMRNTNYAESEVTSVYSYVDTNLGDDHSYSITPSILMADEDASYLQGTQTSFLISAHSQFHSNGQGASDGHGHDMQRTGGALTTAGARAGAGASDMEDDESQAARSTMWSLVDGLAGTDASQTGDEYTDDDEDGVRFYRPSNMIILGRGVGLGRAMNTDRDYPPHYGYGMAVEELSPSRRVTTASAGGTTDTPLDPLTLPPPPPSLSSPRRMTANDTSAIPNSTSTTSNDNVLIFADEDDDGNVSLLSDRDHALPVAATSALSANGSANATVHHGNLRHDHDEEEGFDDIHQGNMNSSSSSNNPNNETVLTNRSLLSAVSTSSDRNSHMESSMCGSDQHLGSSFGRQVDADDDDDDLDDVDLLDNDNQTDHDKVVHVIPGSPTRIEVDNISQLDEGNRYQASHDGDSRSSNHSVTSSESSIRSVSQSVNLLDSNLALLLQPPAPQLRTTTLVTGSITSDDDSLYMGPAAAAAVAAAAEVNIKRPTVEPSDMTIHVMEQQDVRKNTTSWSSSRLNTSVLSDKEKIHLGISLRRKVSYSSDDDNDNNDDNEHDHNNNTSGFQLPATYNSSFVSSQADDDEDSSAKQGQYPIDSMASF